eukprot:TRINITY_DN677_c1_g1_i1.p1 TRINITY_DN677_c1_g1~~TRINITY_DN677_c1_g1_i1.p1  ORF type:complete len:331 (+),score=68.66 TRINITY_DN677_c1_g1_i1:152-1144(+)
MKFHIFTSEPLELGGSDSLYPTNNAPETSHKLTSPRQAVSPRERQQPDHKQHDTMQQQQQQTHPFWDAYHDGHPCMTAPQHPDTVPVADIEVVTHPLPPPTKSYSSDDSSGDEKTKYDDSQAKNLELRSPGRAHKKKKKESSSGSKRPKHSDAESDSFNWNPPRHPPQNIMKKLISVNCLTKGDFVSSDARWLVPVDHTNASMRAFEYCLKEASSTDHIVILHAREHDLVGMPLREIYNEWYTAVALCKRFYDLLLAAGRHPDSFTFLVPVYHDARKIVIKFAKSLSVDKVVIGKHQEEDKMVRIKNQHWRPFTSYVSGNCSKSTTAIIL